MRILILPLILLVSFMTAGCDLKFGDDIELSGAAFDSTKLAEVSALTGVSFPAGARGVGYYYLGSGIDDALAAKVMIPDHEVYEFKSNTAMTTGADSKASIQIGRSKPWWKIDGLADRIDRKLDLPDARFLELTCGREGSDFVVYLSWITT